MRRDDIPTAQRRHYEAAVRESGAADQRISVTRASVGAARSMAEGDLAREAVFQRPEARS